VIPVKYKWRGGIVLALLACAVFLGLRIRSVNMAVELPLEESYEEGEFVEIGDNYFYQEREKNTGYGIKVISSKFVPYADYVAAYGQDETYLDEGYRPEYVLDIELTIRNSNTDEEVGRGFDFVQMVAIASNEIFQVNNELWTLVRPDLAGELGIRVRPGTEYTVHLPYTRPASMDRVSSPKKLLTKDFHLLLSLYPTKKVIRLTPGM
jgi:hypothetical protein